MKNIDVSIVIPTYNRLWCLPRSVESCRHSECATEIIVVDDGSTDGTWEWLQSQSDLVSIRQDKNQGQTYAVNRGMQEARGAYLRFLDSDDRLALSAIDRQWRAARDSGAQLVYSAFDQVDHDSNRLLRQPPLKDGWNDFTAVQLGEGPDIHFSAMLFERQLALSVPRRPDYHLMEDRMFLTEISLHNPKIVYVEGVASYHYRHAQQMSHFQGLRYLMYLYQYVMFYRAILGELARRGDLTERRKRASCHILWQLARKIAKWDIQAGAQIVEWIQQLDRDFRPLETRRRAWAYKYLGFSRTEKLLHILSWLPGRAQAGGRELLPTDSFSMLANTSASQADDWRRAGTGGNLGR